VSKNAIILGSNSDIAKGLAPLLERDGWSVVGWKRGASKWFPQDEQWDLLINCIGTVAPVGLWHDVEQVADCLYANLLLPVELLKDFWPDHAPGASICFLAGSNPNMIMPGYFAYNVSKMALLKAVEQMDYETPDAKFFALGPGTILTKIHSATLEAKWENPKLRDAYSDVRYLPELQIPRVYNTLKWCIAQPKEVVGGRNICASDVQIDDMARRLKDDNALWKLRRHETR